MNKAYDRVRWDFLFQALHEFGFPPYWVNIIRQCVTSVSYQVLVNGEPSRSFTPKCGLRQGDPLSPYLFVLCMEVMSALLRRAEQEHLIQGISVCRGAPSILHLFFADDSLLFFRVSPRECDQVISILEEFSGLSGQVINYQKSFVKFSPNTPQDYRDYLAASLRLGQRSSLVFLIPKSICDRIDSLCLRFWWRSSAASKGMAMVSSSLLHLPKGMGGLGVRKISTFNQALLAKTAWRIVHHPQLLVSRLYQTRYPALAIHPPSTRVSCPSWGFRSLSRGFQVLDQGIAWKPGAGSRIRILQDTWVSMDRISFRSSLNGLDCPTHVSSLLDPRSYACNIGMVRRFFPDKISSQILALERPTSKTDDFLYWKFALDGKFTVRSAYAMLLCSSHHAAGVTSLPSSSWWKHFWGLDIIPWFKLFFWKLLHQALPLATFLCQRGLPVDPLCSLCNQDPESDLHLFRDCPLLLNLWSSGPLRMFCPSVALDRFIPWCVQFVNNLSSGPLGLLDCFISMLWAIWVLRNHARFRNIPRDPGAFHVMVEGWRGRCVEVRLLRRSSKESPLFQGSSSRVTAIFGLSNLSVGPTGITVDICLLSDGAWVSSNNNAGIGWILQDPISLIQLGGGAQACVLASALQAELTAC
ncbi:uncharacterized protein [Spinacia oleracea]|uniref:Reverse transcriptase domain-containing protein n=1 Tax=Spinacia oleracea TaxID=3562 RepID=A0ABM3RI28_SPIOL|nr:uncharacterized protein LOC130469805 [Spinacia oleracea]